MCVPFQNPGSGFAHFDHLGGAFLAVATSAVRFLFYMFVNVFRN
jgi:hypothetical protein